MSTKNCEPVCTSVVIPSYNHHEYIIQAIESVLSQEYSGVIDLIVIDDGSTDGSANLIKEFHARRGGFRFVSRSNQGLIRTLNEGLRLARGEYFCELASDDYFPPSSLAQRSDYLRSHHECMAVFADGFLVRGNHETSETLLGLKKEKIQDMLAASDPIPIMLSGSLPVLSTGLFRTEALRQLGGFDEENFFYYEDLDLPIQLALVGQLGFVDAPVIYRRLHETNTSTSTSHIRVEKVFFYAKLLNMREMANYRALLRRQLRRSLLHLGRSLSLSRRSPTEQERKALRLGWQFAWLDPRLLYYLIKLQMARSSSQ